MTDIEGVFACYEYRMIKKRFQRGKKSAPVWAIGPTFPLPSPTCTTPKPGSLRWNVIRDEALPRHAVPS